MAARATRKTQSDGYHHGDLRKAVLDEAFTLLHEGGPDAVSLREVARRLGVSYGAPHHHFPEKGDLFAALATQAFESLETAIGRRLSRFAGDDAAGLLRAVAETYLDFASKDPARYELMFLPELRDRVRFATLHETGGRSLERLATLFEHAESLAPRRAHARAVACWSALHGYAVLANAGFLEDGKSTHRDNLNALLDSVVVVRSRPKGL